MMHTSVRSIRNSNMTTRVSTTASEPSHSSRAGYTGMMELDSHANTETLGANFRAIAFTEKVCNIQPYHPDYPAQSDVPIAQATTVYTDPQTGESYILVINQALFMGESLPASLISPFQLHSHGILVDEYPKQLSPKPSPTFHSVYITKIDLRFRE